MKVTVWLKPKAMIARYMSGVRVKVELELGSATELQMRLREIDMLSDWKLEEWPHDWKEQA